MGGNEIVRANAFEPANMTELVRFAEYIAESGLVPSHLRNRPKDIVVIAIRARELGVPMFAAMSMIYLVEGRVSMSAELWVAIVKRSPECEYFRLVESTVEAATYECKRRGASPVRLTYTIAEAKTAGLAGKGTWSKHPAAMLRARCSAALARAEFPDAALGVVEHDEYEEITGRPAPVRAQVETAPAPPAPAAEAPTPKALEASPGPYGDAYGSADEMPAEPPPASPLQPVLDDLESLGVRVGDIGDDTVRLDSERRISVDEASAIYNDHPALPGDWKVTAFKVLLAACPKGTKSAQLQRACFIEKWSREIAACDGAVELKALWLGIGEQLTARQALWDTAEGRALVGGLQDKCEARMRALTPPDGPGTGGGAPTEAHRGEPVGSTQAAEGHGAGAQASAADLVAAWRAHVETKRDAFAVAGSYLKHERALRKASIVDACLAVAAERVATFLGTDSRNAAIAFIRAQPTARRGSQQSKRAARRGSQQSKRAA